MVHPHSSDPSMGDSTVAGDPASTMGTSTPSGDAPHTSVLPEPGARFGRFEIVRQLGAGAMGVVMLARDVDLARPVAIKFLRAGVDEAANQRLLREAQAVARLQHPNVVAVHEVGHTGGQVWVVMEFVDGGTLRQWCAAAQRSWTEIVEIYVQAALGLQAAHDAGLVHRDFKPDNALVGTDGRVRVSDFGLVGGSIGEAAFTEDAQQDVTLTRTGAVLGTPAYMAPEQFAGADVGPAADQFALCVALFEALYGARPFAGSHFMQILEAIESGTMRAQTRADVPSPIHGAIVRGFARRPELRHPSMGALAQALRWRPPVPAAKTSPAVVVAIAVAVLGVLLVVGGFALWARRERRVEARAEVQQDAAPVVAAAWPCTGAPPTGASWDDERRTALTTAFTATGSPFAAEHAKHTIGALDAYAAALDRVANETCATPPEAKVQARIAACLANGVDALDGSALALTKDVTPEIVENAPNIAAGLPSPMRCGDVDSVLADGVPPTQPREQLGPPRRAVWYAFALLQANDLARAEAMLAAVRETVDGLDVASLDLQHVLVRARIATARGDGVAAEGAYREALAHARAASDLTMQTVLLADLAQTNVSALGRVADAEAIAAQLRELMPHAALDIRWYGHGALATVALGKGDLATAEAELSAQIDQLDALSWPRPIAVAATHMTRANLRAQLGRKDEALADVRASLDASARVGGTKTTLHATLLTEAAMIHMVRGESTDARARLDEARAILSVASAGARAALSESLLRFADLERQTGAFDAAARLLEEAVGLAEAAEEPERVARISIELAMTELMRARYDEAAARIEAAADISGKFPQSRHIDVLRLAELRSGIAWARAEYSEAIAIATQRIGLIEARFGPMTAAIATARTNLVEMHTVQGDCTLAMAELARALRVRETLGLAPDLDLVRLLAAKATCAVRDDDDHAAARELIGQITAVPEAVAPKVLVTPRVEMIEAEIAYAQDKQAEARAHAKEARAVYASMGSAWSVQVRDIDHWIEWNLDEDEAHGEHPPAGH